MHKYLIAQMTQSNLLDSLTNFEVIEANTEKEGIIIYAKKQKISKHYAYIAAIHFDYCFHQKNVWSIIGRRESPSDAFLLTYKKLKELNLEVTDTCEDLYKTYTL